MNKKTICLALTILLLLLAVTCGQRAKPLADGAYRVPATLSGGTGRAKIASPGQLTVTKGEISATFIWSSANYDYMVVDGTKYEAEIREERSEFEIPVAALDKELSVIADTVAMSTPHEIEYTLLFDSATLTPEAG